MTELNQYYTAVVAISVFAQAVLLVLIYENGRLEKKIKHLFYRTCVVLMIAVLTEWGAVALNGARASTIGLHTVVKCLDYIVTPFAAFYFVKIVSKESRASRVILGILIANAILQFISIFTGWTFYVDADNYYRHGEQYFLYIGVFAVAILYVIVEFLRYGNTFKRRNRGSLYLIFAMFFMGVILQEFVKSSLRTAVLSLSIDTILLFIHFSEFSQIRGDEDLSIQRTLANTDALTGMYSRNAYNSAIETFDKLSALPEELSVFSIDVNGLKSVNDNLGHAAGDELICGAAGCINAVLGRHGRCFRTGGDEFIVLSRMDASLLEKAEQDLRGMADSWQGKKAKTLSLSIGWCHAADMPGISLEALIAAADKRMYADKAAYYTRTGYDRRHR